MTPLNFAEWRKAELEAGRSITFPRVFEGGQTAGIASRQPEIDRLERELAELRELEFRRELRRRRLDLVVFSELQQRNPGAREAVNALGIRIALDQQAEAEIQGKLYWYLRSSAPALLDDFCRINRIRRDRLYAAILDRAYFWRDEARRLQTGEP